MFVITADQVDSRSTTDLVETALTAVGEQLGPRLLLPPDRTAGDELQTVTDDAATALDAILLLTRSGRWSVGCGIGAVKTPLPAATRAASGPAFVHARTAVELAKKRVTRFALVSPTPSGTAAVGAQAADVEPLIDLLLLLRARRSDEGWELHDLLLDGLTQNEAAAQLTITPQAVSQRAQAAQLRAETAARPALVRLLADADGSIADGAPARRTGRTP